MAVVIHILDIERSRRAGVPDEVHEAMKAQVATLAKGDRSVRAFSIRCSAQDHRDWTFHSNRRFVIRRAWAAFFEDWDILICPQMPTAAFPHDHGPVRRTPL